SSVKRFTDLSKFVSAFDRAIIDDDKRHKADPHKIVVVMPLPQAQVEDAVFNLRAWGAFPPCDVRAEITRAQHVSAIYNLVFYLPTNAARQSVEAVLRPLTDEGVRTRLSGFECFKTIS